MVDYKQIVVENLLAWYYKTFAIWKKSILDISYSIYMKKIILPNNVGEFNQ